MAKELRATRIAITIYADADGDEVTFRTYFAESFQDAAKYLAGKQQDFMLDKPAPTFVYGVHIKSHADGVGDYEDQIEASSQEEAVNTLFERAPATIKQEMGKEDFAKEVGIIPF